MANLLRWCARIAGLAALVLGILLWRGIFAGAVNLHMTLGGIVAGALALLAIFALLHRVRMPFAVAALAWAAVVVYVGIAQTQWLPGGSHWIVAVIHLLLGIGAIGMAEALAGALTRV